MYHSKLLPNFENPKSIDSNAEYVPLAVVMAEVRNKREKVEKQVRITKKMIEEALAYYMSLPKPFEVFRTSYVPQKLSGKYTIRLESISEVKPEF